MLLPQPIPTNDDHFALSNHCNCLIDTTACFIAIHVTPIIRHYKARSSNRLFVPELQWNVLLLLLSRLPISDATNSLINQSCANHFNFRWIFFIPNNQNINNFSQITCRQLGNATISPNPPPLISKCWGTGKCVELSNNTVDTPNYSTSKCTIFYMICGVDHRPFCGCRSSNQPAPIESPTLPLQFNHRRNQITLFRWVWRTSLEGDKNYQYKIDDAVIIAQTMY